MRVLTKILGVALVLMASSAARAETVKCSVEVNGRYSHFVEKEGYIAKEIWLHYDPTTEKLTVEDSATKKFNKGKPAKATIGTETDAMRSFNWSVFMLNRWGQRTKMVYQASYFFATRDLRLMARPMGYSNTFDAAGKCVPVED